MLRKFIVKRFVGNYIFKFGSMPRASSIIAPLLLIPGVIDLLSDKIGPNIWMFIPFIISVLISFVYLQIKPAKYEELDKSQKEQYEQFKRFNP